MVKRKRRINFSLLKTLSRLVWRHPWLGVTLIVIALGAYGYEVWVARPAMAWMGLPQATQVQPAYWTRVLRNEGFMVGYSELRANPLWVIYRLTRSSTSERLKRPGRFDTDWRSLARIGHEDYSRSGYTRGHLAPNHAMAQLHGRAGQLDSFLMTNITPQRAVFNSQVWQRLERWELDVAAQRYGTVWVITGPIFDNRIERLKSSVQVEIPDAFYKIVAVPAEMNHGTPLLQAFVVPQDVTGREATDDFITTVDRVEELSGFDFFSELPDELEERLESGLASGLASR